MLNFTYTHYPNKLRPLFKQKFAYFFLAGVGIFYGQPRADLFHGDANMANRYYYWNDGTVHTVSENSGVAGQVITRDGVYETNLLDWKTEGQGFSSEVKRKKEYSLTNIGFPFGAGIRYGYSRSITLSAEVNYYYFLTDFLDDASDRYASYEELTAAFPDKTKFELAKYISDPTGKGTNGFIGPPITSPRGNPGLKDSFTFFSIEMAYKLTLKKKSVYGQLALN
jgi:hypothetical protein